MIILFKRSHDYQYVYFATKQAQRRCGGKEKKYIHPINKNSQISSLSQFEGGCVNSFRSLDHHTPVSFYYTGVLFTFFPLGSVRFPCIFLVQFPKRIPLREEPTA